MKQYEIINLTSHDVVDAITGNTYPISGRIARIPTQEEKVALSSSGTPIIRLCYSEPVGIPEPKEGIMYLVSAVVMNEVHNRDDLICPGRPVRDGTGQKVVACRGFRAKSSSQ